MKSVSQLLELVSNYIRDSEDTLTYMTCLKRALDSYESYKKLIKTNEKDDPYYENSFVYYHIAKLLLKEKCPSFKEFQTNVKCLEIYKDLMKSITNDENIKEIESYISKNSQCNPFEFKHNGVIDCKQLKFLLDKYNEKLLLIDYRDSYSFKQNHIQCHNIINIDPISVRSGYQDSDVENLSIMDGKDQELFRQRGEFELIIIYDGGDNNVESNKLYKILLNRSFAIPLIRRPLCLKGGIQSWIETFGISRLNQHHGMILQPRRTISRDDSGYVRTFNEYLSDPLKQDLGGEHNRPHSAPILQQQVTPIKRKSSFKLPSISSVSKSPVVKSPIIKTNGNGLKKKESNNNNNNNNNNNDNDDGNVNRKSTPQPLIVKDKLQISELHIITGLYNLGNSCYMNCILQCLIGTLPLVEIFLDGTYSKHVNINSKLGSKGIMARYFAELIQGVYNNNSRVFEPRNFKNMIGSINIMFRNNQQQDCSEFLNFLLDGLHEDLNENGNKPRQKELTKEEELLRESMPLRLASTIEWERYLKSDFSAIVYFFQGQYASQLKCLECGTTSTTYQSFSVLSLPIPEGLSSYTLQDCFEEFTKLEILDGDNRWNCSNCEKLRKSTKRIIITRLPMNLIIHLKRFKRDSNYNISFKIKDFIKYPMELNLTKYWTSTSSVSELNELQNFPLRGQEPPFQYKLYGVVNHDGNLSGGHYTSYVWKGLESKWCLFDDTRVKRRVGVSEVVNPSAYVLFYGRVF